MCEVRSLQQGEQEKRVPPHPLHAPLTMGRRGEGGAAVQGIALGPSASPVGSAGWQSVPGAGTQAAPHVLCLVDLAHDQ